MRIALLGSGNMGATLGRRWAEHGHVVAFSSRHPESLAKLAASVGEGRALSIEDAARWCEAAFLGVPFHATREVAAVVAPLLAGKVLLDAGNLIEQRDGDEARKAREAGGSGLYTQSLFPAARVVKAFNTVHYRVLETGRTPKGQVVGVPLAGDDEDALRVAEQLVRDAGAEPVRIGGLREASRIDHGSPVWNANLDAAALRSALGSAG